MLSFSTAIAVSFMTQPTSIVDEPPANTLAVCAAIAPTLTVNNLRVNLLLRGQPKATCRKRKASLK